MNYYLKCNDCSWTDSEESYLLNCPICNGLIEVELSIPRAERKIFTNKPSIFKYSDYLPFGKSVLESANLNNIESIPETPIFVDKELSEYLDVELVVKDETILPTGTWKDKEGFIIVDRFLRNNIKEFWCFSSGNTGTSIARVVSLMKKCKMHLVLPKRSLERIENIKLFYDPSYVFLHPHNGSNDECIDFVKQIAKKNESQTEGGFHNYARREGIKLLALETYFSRLICEKPKPKIDWYCQAVAGGVGIYSFYKGCKDIGVECPRILGVQSNICAPMVNSWKDNSPLLLPRHIPSSIVPSEYVKVLRTRNPGFSYKYLYKIMKKVNGAFEDVSENEIGKGLKLFYRSIYFQKKFENQKQIVGLEAATALAGIIKAIKTNIIKKGSRVLLVVSGAAKKNDVKIEWIKSDIHGYYS